MHRWKHAERWAALKSEFDAWAQEGRQATLWWRDDDATAPGPKLDTLLEITGETPICLAEQR